MSNEPSLEERMGRQEREMQEKIAKGMLDKIVSVNKVMRECLLQIRDASYWVTTLKEHEPVTDEEMVILKIHQLIEQCIETLESRSEPLPEKPKPKIILS